MRSGGNIVCLVRSSCNVVRFERRERGDKGKGPPTGRPSTLFSAQPLFRRRQRGRLGGRFGLDGGLALALGEDELIALDGDLASAVHLGAGAGGDQPADDDVLLEAFKRVDLAVDGG